MDAKTKKHFEIKTFLRPCLKEEGFYKTPNWHIITFTLMRELTQILTASLYLHKYDCPQPMRALHLGMCTRNCQVCFHSRESIHHSVQHIRRYLRGYIFKIIDFSMVQYCSATLLCYVVPIPCVNGQHFSLGESRTAFLLFGALIIFSYLFKCVKKASAWNPKSDAQRFAQEVQSIFLALITATMCCTFNMYFSATNVLAIS